MMMTMIVSGFYGVGWASQPDMRLLGFLKARATTCVITFDKIIDVLRDTSSVTLQSTHTWRSTIKMTIN